MQCTTTYELHVIVSFFNYVMYESWVLRKHFRVFIQTDFAIGFLKNNVGF